MLGTRAVVRLWGPGHRRIATAVCIPSSAAPCSRSPTPRERAFTITELVVTIAIIAVLIAILVPTVTRIRRAQQSAACLATLRQIAEAFSLYTHDNQMRLPDPGLANLSWEQMLSRYHQAPFACPSDNELFPSVGSSYDWRDTGNRDTTLAGRAVADVTRPTAALAFEALPGWHGRHKINVARVDGSVLTLQEDEFFHDLAAPVKEQLPAARQ